MFNGRQWEIIYFHKIFADKKCNHTYIFSLKFFHPQLEDCAKCAFKYVYLKDISQIVFFSYRNIYLNNIKEIQKELYEKWIELNGKDKVHLVSNRD